MKKYQEIIFMETTEDYSGERYGVLTLPEQITTHQYEKIMTLESYFGKFKSIMIQGKLISDGIIVMDSEIKEMIDGNNIERLQEILNSLIEKEEKHL